MAAVAAVAGVGGLLLVVAVLGEQMFPRDGGLLALLTTVAVLLSAACTAVGAVRAPRLARGSLALGAGIGLVAVVGAGVLLAPGWPLHRVDAADPVPFVENTPPSSVTRVGWRADLPAGALGTVLGGRVVVVRTDRSAGHCDLRVDALDATDGSGVWSVRRPLRCDGPQPVALDGSGSIVRVTLRPPGSAGGPVAQVHLRLEDGRALTPSASLEAVSAWTEGSGLVDDGTTLAGLDPATGATSWSRPLPRCDDGSTATLGLPTPATAGIGGARSPYDDASPPGAVPVRSTGVSLAFGWSCPAADGRDTRRAWLVDTAGSAAGDHVVALPDGIVASGPTTFATGLASLVAAVPTAAGAWSLTGIDAATGGIRWQRGPAAVTALSVQPATGDVAVSVTGAAGARTTLLAGATGSVLAEHPDPAPVRAAVGLLSSRVQFAADGVVTDRDPLTGAVTATVTVPDCRVELDDALTPAVLGPGGLVLRCTTGTGLTRLVGLVQ